MTPASGREGNWHQLKPCWLMARGHACGSEQGPYLLLLPAKPVQPNRQCSCWSVWCSHLGFRLCGICGDTPWGEGWGYLEEVRHGGWATLPMGQAVGDGKAGLHLQVWEAWSCALPSQLQAGQLAVITTELAPRSAMFKEEGSIMREMEGWKQVIVWGCKSNPLRYLYRIGARLWVWQTTCMIRWEEPM